MSFLIVTSEGLSKSRDQLIRPSAQSRQHPTPKGISIPDPAQSTNDLHLHYSHRLGPQRSCSTNILTCTVLPSLTRKRHVRS